MNRLYSILIFLISALSLNAQITPPQLSCIDGNGVEIEIYWSPPVNTCGVVLGYVVYFSDNIDGPYNSFIINDPAILDTTFASSSDPIFCFMQSLMFCPGEPFISSDTLMYSLSPPIINSVSVNASNQIVVTWDAIASPDIAAYLIYVDGANFPDTVWGVNNTTYVDLVSDPTNTSHNYKIAWFRNCVNDGDRRGSIGNSYNSILLQDLQQDKCNRAFSFSWGNYENYSLGITGYQINVSENNGSFIAIDTAATNQLIYLFTNAVDESLYCFKVAALLPNGLLAYSNTTCDTAAVVVYPTGAHIRNATVISPNTVRIEYFPDTSGVILDLNPQRSESGSNFQTWPVNGLGSSGTIPSYDIYEDNNATTSSDSYYYRFRRLDDCEGEHISDTVRTILLNANLGFRLVGELEWTPYEHTYGTVVEYTIYKYINGVSTILTAVGPNVLSYEDIDAINTATLDTICYEIVAQIDIDIPNFISTTVTSHSNISCLEPKPSVVAPSAFKPEGLNTIFKPILIFGTDENYDFRVYDRYGKLLFETNNPDEGWDGRYKDQLLGLEAFVYYVSFVGQDGLTYSKTGPVILIR